MHRYESRFERWRPVPGQGWRRESGDPADAGGLLFDPGSHLIDQALVLWGPVRRVYAEVERRRPGVAVDDDAFVALEHASGVRSHLCGPARGRGRRPANAGAGEPRRVREARAGRAGSGDPRRRAPGTGMGEEPEARWGRLSAGEDWTPVRTEPGDWPAYYAGIAAALRKGGPPPVDPGDAVAGLRVIEAARRSAAEHGVIALA
ncbi:MAG TPA: Gfo/Idh/MocA family oxidoreductase [Longimicrobium sp.]|nr:Gfo/Idh/MocA family oxidoreductase [Longimicrobium sp.]